MDPGDDLAAGNGSAHFGATLIPLSESDQPPADPPDADPTPPEEDVRPPLSRRALTLIITPLIIMVIAANIGDALAPQWVDKHPLWLTALNARNRNLVLVTNNLDAWSYYLVASVRLLLSDPLFYILGFFYGDRAIVWLERRSSTFGNIIRTWESLFRKASYPLVFIAPNNFICLFAGSAGMRPAAFVTLNVSGTFFRLFLIRQVGEAFSSPIDSLLGFIQDYRWPLTALSVGVVLFTIMNDRRSGRGDLEALAHIEDDLEGPPGPPPTDQD
jgi:membrane protein DedA with SNARE-associated domain